MIRTGYLKWFISTALLIVITGCGSVQETLYLGNVKIDAPIATPPTHFTFNNKPGVVTISPKFVMNSQKQIEASTESRYTRNIKFSNGKSMSVAKKNLEWKFSEFSVGTDLDINLTNTAALFGGLNFSSSKGSELFGGNIGLGLYSVNENSAFRLDLGATFQNYSYEALTIAITRTTWLWGNPSTDTSFFFDRNTQLNFNPFFNLTYNSLFNSSPINFLISVGYFSQNLLNFDPHGTEYESLFLVSYSETDTRPDCKVGFFYFNPGIVYSVNDKMKIICSVKICKETLLDNSSESWFVLPSMQVNFEL